jgi:hypothetical protein
MNDYWTFEIFPSGNYLTKFENNISYHYSIGQDYDLMPLNFLLNSKHFGNKTSPNEVYILAIFITKLINGYNNIIHLDSDDSYKVRIGKLYKNGEENRDNLSVSNFNFLGIDKLFYYTDVQKDKGYCIISKGFECEYVRNILLYASEEWNLTNMYKISDELKYFLNKNGDDIYNYVSKSNLKKFGNTANNFNISGLSARHGRGNLSSSGKIFSIEECSEYVRNYLNEVLTKYYNLKLNFKEKQDWNIDVNKSDISKLLDE